MLGVKANSSIRTVALGANVTSSTYGMTIPRIFGRAKTSLLLTWANNLRMGTSGKAAKKGTLLGPVFSKIFGLDNGYLENVDFLVGHNPIMGALQFWVNQAQWLPLNFTSYSQSFGFPGPSSVSVPDAEFYAVIGVTVTQLYGANIPGYPFTTGTAQFNDYGGQGPQTLTGSYETPCWNIAQTGPNPTDIGCARFWPYVYQWVPGSNVVEFPAPGKGLWPEAGGIINIYYAQLDPNGAKLYDKKNSGTAIPIAALQMIFENVMGAGGIEYYLPGVWDFRSQQILYPHYAGMGSGNLDLGTTNNIPNIQPEIQGSFGLYSTGDCDFADMIEDTFNGATQAGITNSTPATPLQHGLNCQSYPGCIQNVSINGLRLVGNPLVFQYPQPNTAGNFLVVALATSGGSVSSISDSAGNSWTPVFGSPSGDYQVYTATAVAYSVGGQGTTVTINYTLSGLPTVQGILLEVAGVDTLTDVESTTSGSSISVTSDGASNNPAYLLAWAGLIGQLEYSGPANILNWTIVEGAKNVSTNFVMYGRQVAYPGSYTITVPPTPFGYSPTAVALLCFTNSQPVAYPKPLGDILDHDSWNLVRQQCRAAGLYGSVTMDSQRAGSDWLKDFADAADAAPVWSGFVLKGIPWSEVSAVGNGAVYNAPTASGPIYNLTEADFVADKGAPPVTVERTAQLTVPDLLQIQQPDRSAQYNDTVISQPETGAIALYGPRKASPVQMRMFQDPAVGRMYLGIMERRQNYLRRTYKFQTGPKFWPLEAMDLITIPLSATMPNSNNSMPYIPLPVRVTSVSADPKYQLSIEAQDFIYGTNAPVPLDVTTSVNNFPQTGATPADINPPVIFEPVPRLEGNASGELWVVVSNSDSNFGGCQVWISTDGGTSYTDYGSTVGNGVTGYLTADWPAAEDPDTSNDLAVDLTESNGVLSGFSVGDENNFASLSFVSGPAGAAAGYVQSPAGTFAHSVTSLANAFADNNTAGNAIVVCVGCYQGANENPAQLAVSDSQGNIYTIAGTSPPVTGPGVVYQAWMFTAFGIAAGVNTVTVYSNTTVDLLMTIQEESNVNAVDNACGAEASSGALGSGLMSTRFNGERLFSMFYDGNGGTGSGFTPGSQFILRTRVNNTASFGRGAIGSYDGPSFVTNNAFYTTSGVSGPVSALTVALTKVASTPAPGVVQATCNIAANAGGISMLTVAFNRNITAGNAILVSVGIHSYGGLNYTVTDTLGNTYSLIGKTSEFLDDGETQSGMWVTFGSSAGANTVTVTPSDSIPGDVQILDVQVQEIYGVAPVSMSVLVRGFSTDIATPGESYPFTLSGDNAGVQGDLLVAVGCGFGANGISISPFYSQLTRSPSPGLLLAAAAAYVTPVVQEFSTSSTGITFNVSGGGGTTRGATAMFVCLAAANPPVQDDYELMSYAVANMTAPSKYTLMATGGGNELRRAVYGAPQPNQGDDHPVGARFAYIGQGASGLIKLNFDSNLTHATINLKFPAFNSFLGGLQSQADIPAYGYTFSGLSQQNNPNTYNYSVTPADCLSNPNATTIDIAQTTVQFPSNAVNYNARALTITAPSVPTQYFVTIYDPGYLGDPDSTTDLTAQASTDQSLIGTFGYTYMGSIICLPGGGGTTVTPGGLPLELGGSSANFVEEIPTGTLNGVNKIFTLSFTPNPTGSLFLFLNGVLQVISVDYTVTGSTITFTAAPVSDDDMIAQYTH